MVKPARAAGERSGDRESIGRRQNEILRFVLILLLGSLQRRDGRRNNSATAACPSTGSSHCSRRNLESCFSNSFVHVRLAVYRDTPVPLTIDGHPALQDELTGTEKGTNVVFLHTTVDDGDHFQQNLAWTLKSRWQKQNELLREVTASFRSEK